MKQIALAILIALGLSTCGFAAEEVSSHLQKFIVPRPPGWGKDPDPSMVKRTEAKHQAIIEMKPDIIFVGDSITQNWEQEGAALWKQHFAPLKAANYGVGGLKTCGALWAIKEFKWDGVSPKVVVVLIGANDGDAGRDLFEGQKKLVQLIHDAFPSAKVVFIPALPCNIKFQYGTSRFAATNKYAPELEKEFSYVKVVDLTSMMLNEKGEVTKEVFKDGQHLTEKGYQIWAEAILPVIKPILASSQPGK